MAAPAAPEFPRDLGARGWLGMALPREYGGGGRTAVECLVVVEDLLAVGAPVGYHWIADRQSGPNIGQNGTEEQKRALLPGHLLRPALVLDRDERAKAGSDLASVRTRAVPTDGGRRVTGTKTSTTGASDATHILALFRTSADRYAGLTQFIVDRDTDGLTVTPIPSIDGSREYRMQQITLRLNAWRDGFGNEQSLAFGPGAELREGSLARTITVPGGSKEHTWQTT
jgi:alkylation response protein AidB-like acyl-CoA dehydrogenase